MERVKGLNIRIWMMMNGITSRKIAKGYGCAYPIISKFLSKAMTSRGLAEYFIEQGCPAEYFKDGKVADRKVAA